MAQTESRAKVKLTRFGWWWLGGIALIDILAWISGFFVNATELVPDHGITLQLCFVAAGLAAAVSMLVFVFHSSGRNWARLVVGIISIGGLSTLGTFMLASTVSDLCWQAHDFPPGKTMTTKGRLLIGRAYRTRSGWVIQTMPIWSNIDISMWDADFMLAHRRPGDRGLNRNEISSEGYFCANVILQTSGAAIRVLNAGRGALPAGSVSICSTGATAFTSH